MERCACVCVRMLMCADIRCSVRVKHVDHIISLFTNEYHCTVYSRWVLACRWLVYTLYRCICMGASIRMQYEFHTDVYKNRYVQRAAHLHQYQLCRDHIHTYTHEQIFCKRFKKRNLYFFFSSILKMYNNQPD